MDSNSEYINKQKSNPWAVLLCRQIIIKDDIQRARSRLVSFCSWWWGIKKNVLWAYRFEYFSLLMIQVRELIKPEQLVAVYNGRHSLVQRLLLIASCGQLICLTHWGRDKIAPIFPDDILTCIFWNKIVWTSIIISLKFVPTGPIDNGPALVQIMVWRWTGDRPLGWINNGLVCCRIYATLSLNIITMTS